MYIDTHTHLYDPQLTIDPQHIQRAIEAGVHTMYMPNCDSETIEPMLAVADSFPQNCLPMMGLHPCYVKENYKWELEQVALHLSKRKYYGIGEVGLDYHWDLTYVEQQKDALRTQIGYARQYGLPVILHSRKSTADCIKLIKEQQDGSLTGIFHCFSGSFEEAKEIIKLGFYLGIGGVVTYKNSGLNSVLTQIGLDRVVLETDAPYLAPDPYRGKRNESSHIPYIAAHIAKTLKIPMENVASITTKNAKDIFKSE